MYPSYNWHIWKVNYVSKDTRIVYDLITSFCPNADFLRVHTMSMKLSHIQGCEFYLFSNISFGGTSIHIKQDSRQSDQDSNLLPPKCLCSLTGTEVFLQTDNVVFENRQCLVNMYVACVPGGSQHACRWWKTSRHSWSRLYAWDGLFLSPARFAPNHVAGLAGHDRFN